MDSERLRALLDAVAGGRMTAEDAMARLRDLPYADLGFAKVDLHRALRAGGAEAIFCPGKTPAQVVAILQRLVVDHVNVIATRADEAVVAAVAGAGLPHVWHPLARLILARPEPREGIGLVVVAAAGTADLPVAEEAALVAEALGNRVERVTDCGVAGLHRLLAHRELLAEANAIIAVAGMEGALPSVIGGLVDRPVIAVPTSVGYGTSLNGLAALLAMLNSCAPGVSVVNVDNIYAAAHQDHRMLGDIVAILERSHLPAPVTERARRIFERLADAEARVHGTTRERVHFHDVGAVDAIVDVTGGVLGLHLLRVETVYVSPLPLGGGFADGPHGRMPIPGPGTAELLRGFPVVDTGVRVELVTPTGAAILTTLAKPALRPPAMTLAAVGYGAGTRDLPDTPNVLRCFVGEAVDSGGATEAIVQGETTIDDMSPQLYEP